MISRYTICILVLLLASSLAAQTPTVADSTFDSLRAVFDTTQTDSLEKPLAATIEDSIRIVFPYYDLDTLNEAQRLLAEHETRFYLRRQDEMPPEIGAQFSFFDSLTAYYLSARWDLREDIDRSFFHDAGDYAKSDPSYLVSEATLLPFRKTIQPYGLSGNRLGLVVGGRSLTPFEHVIEPDGLVDLNDVPTALDQTVAMLPGPVGQLFGSQQAVATMLTIPGKPAGNDPESAFIVDKGGLGFSYARGRYSKLFTRGRELEMSIGYRRSDGSISEYDDDAYHYTARLVQPLGPSWQLNGAGRLYKRHGSYVVRPALNGSRLDRDRFDRDATLSLSRHNADRNDKVTLGYRFLRQGSALQGDYQSNLNQKGHGLFVGREWLSGTTLFSGELSADYLQYDNWSEQHRRYSGRAELTMARLSFPWGWVLKLQEAYVEDYKSLPSVTLMTRYESDRSYWMASAGYSERAPSLNELYLPYQVSSLYDGYSQAANYADGGNSQLVSEKQFIGTSELSLGSLANNLTVAVTGGQIWDGIDWQVRDSTGLTVFSPINGDLRFATATATARFGLWKTFGFKLGGSYHYFDYDKFDSKPYTPEYQAFAGGEMYLYWSQKLIDFWAYGEVAYVGPYDGYVETGLGDRLVINTKLSFRMGNFRFNWIVQNSMLSDFNTRDYFPLNERYMSYGFTWNFFD